MRETTYQCAPVLVSGQSLTFCAKVTSFSKSIDAFLLHSSHVHNCFLFPRSVQRYNRIEVDCGEPFPIPHSVMLWNKVSTVGSQVVYECDRGYVNVGEGNVSVCTAGGEWQGTSLYCQGDHFIIYLQFKPKLRTCELSQGLTGADIVENIPTSGALQ